MSLPNLKARPCAPALQSCRAPKRARHQLCRAETQDVAGPAGAFREDSKGAVRQELFNNISGVYDELNDRLSFGQHKVWKRMAVKWAGTRPGHRALDICCGSGDLAFILQQAAGPTGRVTGLDFAQDMLDDAAVRAAGVPRPSGAAMNPIQWLQGDAMDLPFAEASFDSATMGYGLRNVSDIPTALRELRRVLKPGCKAAILDFNNSPNSVIDGAQQLFLDNLVVPAAREYGLAAEYEYLRPSIKAFPQGVELERLALQAGFTAASHYEITFGMMCVLVVQR